MIDELSTLESAAEAVAWAKAHVNELARMNGNAAQVWSTLATLGVTVTDLLALQDQVTQRRNAEADPGAAFGGMTTDLGNANRFAVDHRGKVLYTKAHGWLCWDGRRWAEDDTGGVERLARLTVQRIWNDVNDVSERLKTLSTEAGDGDGDKADEIDKLQKRQRTLSAWAVKSQQRTRQEAMLALARSEVGIAARGEDFDAKPWLLNVANGTLDLHTGKLRKHDPGDKLTRLIDVDYHPDAAAPTWLAFLDRVQPDADVRTFLQRYTGYSLTGDTSEQCLAFLYGSGRNGKSVYSDLMLRLLGGYGLKMSTETLTETRRQAGAATEDVARLHGKRLYVASEWKESAPLAENFVKELTGGDMLTARFLHKGSFDFKPEGKLLIYGNHKPVIKGDDFGIWRRIRLVPFAVTIPEAEVDPKLTDKLRAELPGILAWAVRGCLDWQAHGLGNAEAVHQATAEYRESSDVLGAWFSECCKLDPTLTTPASALFGAWSSWANENGHKPMNVTWFGRRLSERGLRKERTTAGVKWVGISLNGV